jgi:hypothetical protein
MKTNFGRQLHCGSDPIARDTDRIDILEPPPGDTITAMFVEIQVNVRRSRDCASTNKHVQCSSGRFGGRMGFHSRRMPEIQVRDYLKSTGEESFNHTKEEIMKIRKGKASEITGDYHSFHWTTAMLSVVRCVRISSGLPGRFRGPDRVSGLLLEFWGRSSLVAGQWIREIAVLELLPQRGFPAFAFGSRPQRTPTRLGISRVIQSPLCVCS